jgi:hypothetical protein
VATDAFSFYLYLDSLPHKKLPGPRGPPRGPGLLLLPAIHE